MIYKLEFKRLRTNAVFQSLTDYDRLWSTVFRHVTIGKYLNKYI